MSELRRFDERVWDRFFAFVYECEPRQSRQEVQAELRRLGINAKPAVSAVLQAVEAAGARARLAAARSERTSIGLRIGSVVPSTPHAMRDNLRQLIAQRFGTGETAAYWYKLEKEASDDDLKSLLDDFHLLERLSEDQGDGGAAGQ
jgi:phage terminase Nu1 subunit (DNA packaging protein)